MTKRSPFATQYTRQHLVGFVLRLVQGTGLEPSAFERALLDQFVVGALTIDQVKEHLAAQPGDTEG